MSVEKFGLERISKESRWRSSRIQSNCIGACEGLVGDGQKPGVKRLLL